MKTNKLTAAALTAALLCPMCALPAQAYNTNTPWLLREENYAIALNGAEAQADGTAQGTLSAMLTGFVIVTDGSALPEDFASTLPDEYNSWTVEPLTWDGEKPVFLAGYAEDAQFYLAHYEMPPYLQDNVIARAVQLENDCVTDVLTISYTVTGAVTWNGTFQGVREEGLGIYHNIDEQLAEDPAYAPAQEAYQAYKNALDAWEAATDTTGMTDAEIAASRAAAGVPTDYEMIVYAKQFAKESLDAEAYEMTGFTAGSVFVPDYDTIIYSTPSVWTGAGDLNKDGIVDASDAAELLALSALKGAGDDSRFTAQQISAADLNGDTFCDANAAAYILQFAAEAGAGSTLSIGEFMTR